MTSIIPSGKEDLKGNEAEVIIKLRKKALGINDPEVAAVHMESIRRIFRKRLETGKLVYVSSLVFGDASKFLLPWKRVFKVTDAQVEVVIRDITQRLF